MRNTGLFRTWIVAFAAMLFTLAAYAAAPEVKTQPPGYYRVLLGDFEITALSDGTVDLPVNKLLININEATVDKTLRKSYLKSPLETSFNGFLINTGTKLVLIDTGAGKFFGPTLGNLVGNLKAAGYQPEQIDEIYLTHMHSDHIGGLLNGDKAAFPNAIVRADKRESDYWLNPANMAKAPADGKASFQNVRAALAPYMQAGKFKPFTADTELVPGIKSHASFGHTAGHNSYIVESKGQKLVVWGDLMHVAAVQFENPDAAMKFDADSKAATIERKKAYADAARYEYMVAGAHLSFPGIGRVRTEGKGYVWVPLNYSVTH